MTTPGFFELYPSARPALPAGSYTASSGSALSANPPAGADGTIPVDGTQFNLHVDARGVWCPHSQRRHCSRSVTLTAGTSNATGCVVSRCATNTSPPSSSTPLMASIHDTSGNVTPVSRQPPSR